MRRRRRRPGARRVLAVPPEEVYNVGFITHAGTVTAADDWSEPAREMRVVPSLEGSQERLLHDAGMAMGPAGGSGAFLTIFDRTPRVRDLLGPWRRERAIGGIYRRRTDRMSHYFTVSLPEQFDAAIHFDTTSGPLPLERAAALNMDRAEAF